MNGSILMPNLGAASDEATLVSWLVTEGERVAIGSPLFEVETDKSVVTVEATEAGVVGHLLVDAGETVSVGTAIAEFEPDRGPAISSPAVSGPDAASAGEAAVTPASFESEASGVRQWSPKNTVAGVRPGNVSPRARRVASQLGIDPTTFAGTGFEGRVTEADVRAAAEARDRIAITAAAPAASMGSASVDNGPASAAPSAADVQLAGLTGMRALIARRMSESARATAAVTLFAEAEAENLTTTVRWFEARTGEVASGVTIDVVIAKCVARALIEHPVLNGSLETSGVVRHERADIGIALDAEPGLTVAVLRDVANTPLADLGRVWSGLRDRAIAGRATVDELRGGTFTITNLGHLGIDHFTPIINPGEVAILGLGRIALRPVVRDGQVVPQRTIPLSLTFDHRVVDGAPAARFLQRVVELVERAETGP